MKNLFLSTAVILLALATHGFGEELQLSKLDLSQMTQDWGNSGAGKSIDGNPLKIAGKFYADGIGTHAVSEFMIQLDGQADEFIAEVGVDAESAERGSVEFRLEADGKTIFKSGILKGDQAAQSVKIPLRGVKLLTLAVSDGGDGISHDHADWAMARIIYSGAAPQVFRSVPEIAEILTPPPGPQPRLTGPRVFGVRPGNPFLHRITATGEKPIRFSADGLPEGLEIDLKSGLISGSLVAKGEWKVSVIAKNSLAEARRELVINCGDQISLTPPMGWNSWNCFAGAVTDSDIRNAARMMASSALFDHGWSYINIDDFWQVRPGSEDKTLQGPERDGEGRILPNPRFPNMPSLTSYIHSLGLKAGIYSSPGPLTCGSCSGSFGHEMMDAETYANWGFDYLKHDWCSYRPEMESTRKDSSFHKPIIGSITDDALLQKMLPYAVMNEALRQQKRDIHFSLCQYGVGNVSQWGDQVGGNSWRTTDDITDTWQSVSKIGFSQAGLERYAKPGNWNDPDMLVVGHVGWGPALHRTRLTPNEQYTHLSLWSLLASPLLIGCDLTKLDDFTLNLLTNDEVIEVNQDPLGKQAARLSQDGSAEMWAKPMSDGSWSVGLFNRGAIAAPVTLNPSLLGLGGEVQVRDLWRQKDLSTISGKTAYQVPRHGCLLLKVWKN
jgi:alpha-galactosidase